MGVPECSLIHTFRAHNDRITGIAINPNIDLVASKGPFIVTGSADYSARVWDIEGNQIAKFTDHEDRLGQIAFHPSGKVIATSCFDHTWNLWELEKACLLFSKTTSRNISEKSIYKQEGHNGYVCAISFNNVGALLVSGGFDAVGKVWDLRTGNNIVTLAGHTKPILSVDFSPDGFHLITSSMDNTCRIWDLRKTESAHILAAHKDLIASVKYHPTTGDYFATASFDGEAKIWASHDFSKIRSLIGHANKVMAIDICPDNNSELIATVSYDRTIKIWK